MFHKMVRSPTYRFTTFFFMKGITENLNDLTEKIMSTFTQSTPFILLRIFKNSLLSVIDNTMIFLCVL